MHQTLSKDAVPCFRVIAATLALAIWSLACRMVIVALVGRSTVVMSISNWFVMAAIGSAIVTLGAYMRSRAIGTFGFGVSVMSIILMYLPDAIEAAVHLGRGFAYADASLAAMDRATGFDWAAYALWLDKHSLLWVCSRLAYLSMPVLPFVVIVVLSLETSTERLATFFVANMVCLSSCAAFVFFMPALGAYEYFGAVRMHFEHSDFVTAAYMTRSLEWLRQASLVGDGVTYDGLVSFPSYHAMACILDAWAVWRSRYAKWPMAALALLILVATPVQGSHYLVDIVAGIGIAIVAIRPSAWLVATLSLRRLSLPVSSAPIPA